MINTPVDRALLRLNKDERAMEARLYDRGIVEELVRDVRQLSGDWGIILGRGNVDQLHAASKFGRVLSDANKALVKLRLGRETPPVRSEFLDDMTQSAARAALIQVVAVSRAVAWLDEQGLTNPKGEPWNLTERMPTILRNCVGALDDLAVLQREPETEVVDAASRLLEAMDE